MAITAILGILGGVLGAGGSAAGGILSKPSSVAPGSNPSFNGATDPLTAFSSLNALAQFGVFDPSLVQIAGPLERAIQSLRGQGLPGGAGNLGGQGRLTNQINEVQEAFRFIENARSEGFTVGFPRDPGRPRDAAEGALELLGGGDEPFASKEARQLAKSLGLEPGQELTAEEASQLTTDQLLTLSGQKKLDKRARNILGASGFNSLDALFDAETEFQQQIQGEFGRFQETAERNREQSRLAQEQLFGLLSSGAANVDELRENELARQRVFMDEFRNTALQEANAGGFNPAGALERSALLEETSQNSALERAISLLSGATTSASLLSALDPSNVGTQLSTALAPLRAPTTVGLPGTTTFGPNNPLGAGIAGAGNQLAGSLNNQILLRMLEQGGGGTTTQRRAGTGIPAGSFLNSPDMTNPFS